MNYFVSFRIHKRYTGQDSGQRRVAMGQKLRSRLGRNSGSSSCKNMIIKDSSTNFRNYFDQLVVYLFGQ